ncbi:DUF2789 domain-containing protein [uncultured Shewanella sp.]|uniref:DUF2789 domain-containing protein n=1 Tax=Shewanella atlantica TaxID=271099 RepID=UPI002613F9B3|nr:DUF2789 domain-containing protein [uncultured Shewanella sp.]
MDTTPQDLSHLFEQLGLENSEESIAEFISKYKIPDDVLLTQAEFWNDSQRCFLKESLEEDAQWSELIDHLDTQLRK